MVVSDGNVAAGSKKAARYSNTMRHQMRILLHRAIKLSWANNITVQNFVMFIGLALVSGLLFMDLSSSEEDIFSLISLTFFFITTWTWLVDVQ